MSSCSMTGTTTWDGATAKVTVSSGRSNQLVDDN